MKTIEGKLDASGLKFGIVIARFNEFISSKLLSGCIDGLKRHGADDENIDLIWSPGAFEIPLLAKKWQGAKSTMPLYALALLSAGPHRISIMWPQKFQKGLPMLAWKPVSL